MSLEPFEPMKQFEFEPVDPFEPPADLAQHAVFAAEWRRGMGAAHWIARLAFVLNAPFGFASGVIATGWSYHRSGASDGAVVALLACVATGVFQGLASWLWIGRNIRRETVRGRYYDWAVLPGSGIPFYPRYVRAVSAPLWESTPRTAAFAWMGFLAGGAIGGGPIFFLLMVLLGAMAFIPLFLFCQIMAERAIGMAAGIPVEPRVFLREQAWKDWLSKGDYPWDLWPGDS